MKTKSWGVHGAILALTASLAACGGGGSGGGGSLAALASAGTSSTGTTGTTGTNGSGGNGGNGGTSAGNGGAGSGSGNSAQQINGVAAVGAPLVGTVTVKDANGLTRSTTIGANGSYAVDVSGMTAPFVFRAEGSVNGTRVEVHSIATAADVNGNINITQLTDLIVANVAGQLAQSYFDKFEQSGNAGLAVPSEVAAEVAKLKEKLLPVLTALGVNAAIDLLHTSFTPLSDPLDKALDVIRVSYDTTANTATISNVVNAITVTDDLAVKAAAETAPTTLSATNVASAASDQDLVRQVLKDFSARFASGLPSSADLSPLMTSSFRWDDMNLADSLDAFTHNADFVGNSFTQVEINQIDYSDPSKVTAVVSFSVLTSGGVELGRLDNWKIRKGTDGIWRMHGNQQVLTLEAFATTAQYHDLQANSTCVKTGLEFNIEDPDASNDGGVISYVLVKGPGLPAAGLRYQQPPLGGRFMIAGAGMETYVLASNCANVPPSVMTDAQIATIPDDARYTFTAYNAADTAIVFPTGTSDGSYRLRIARRPLTMTEAAVAGVFPVIDSATVGTFAALPPSAAATLPVSASNLYPFSQAYVQMRRKDASLADVDAIEQSALPSAQGTISATLALTAAPTAVSHVLWVESPDKYRRNLQSYFQQ